jgi:hypothetical protein
MYAVYVKVCTAALSLPNPDVDFVPVEVLLTIMYHSSADPLVYNKEARLLKLYTALLDLEAERRGLKPGRHSIETERCRSLETLGSKRSGPMRKQKRAL